MLLGAPAFANYVDTQTENVKAVPVSVDISQQQQVQVVVAEEITSDKDALVDITAKIPQVEGLTDVGYQQQLNSMIKNRALQDIEELTNGARELRDSMEQQGYQYRAPIIIIDYEVKNNDDMLSFVVNTYTIAGANGITRVDDYNIDTLQNKPVELKDLFKPDVDYKVLINQEIADQIAAKEEQVYNFETISDTHSYYIEDDNLVVVFSKYEIAPGYVGGPEFKIPLSELSESLLIPTHYAPVVGIVKEIKDYTAIPGAKFITIDCNNSEINNIVLSPDTYVKGDAEITVGAKLISYFDTKSPMILIYPPQYSAKVVMLLEGQSTPDVSKMDIVVNNKIIDASAAYTNAKGIVMVPLRAISEALGYDVKLIGNTIHIGIVSSMTIGEDYYTFAKMAPFKLGTAPELINQNTTFVPLSYFKEVLSMNNAYVFENQIVIDNEEKME